MTCWSCQAQTSKEPFCPACGQIQPRPPGATLFDVFGLRPTLELSLDELDRAFRERSLRLHPDRFATADARARRYSLEQSTALNEAYRTLKDPVRRALYVLKLSGVDLEREDAGAQKDMPLEFLEEVMDLREALEGRRAAKDLPGAQAMAEDVRGRREAALAEANGALREHLAHPEAGEVLAKAAHALARVRYFTRFLEQVEHMEEEALG